jgi:hypothetical protein
VSQPTGPRWPDGRPPRPHPSEPSPSAGRPAAVAPGAAAAPAAQVRADRQLIALLLLAAAALDLSRCGLVVVTAAHPVPTAVLVAAGLAAAAMSLRTARGCRAGRRWACWAALLIGAMSAPQAAASGFRPPYTIPDMATAAVGILLTVTVLATAGRPGQPGPGTETACIICPRAGDQDRAADSPEPRS